MDQFGRDVVLHHHIQQLIKTHQMVEHHLLNNKNEKYLKNSNVLVIWNTHT